MPLQVVQPRIRGFISLTAHPEGCAVNVRAQIEVARTLRAHAPGPRTVLVIGSSTGYGLASLLASAFGYGSQVLGICFERAPEGDKGATAGWYNLAEAHRLARAEGLHIETINGDAFSQAVKTDAIAALRERFGAVDLVVYSLAAPRRTDAQGVTWQSTLKPIGAPYTGKSVDLRSGTVTEISLDAATPEEIEGTVQVMGGADWADWITALRDADLLAEGARTVAYSYVGPRATQDIYRHGTIGRAKEHLEATRQALHEMLHAHCRGGAWVSVNKAVVTQASAAIPGVVLYMSILFKLMKARGTHEGPIEQIVRLYRDHLRPGIEPHVDAAGLIRLDDLELAPEVQAAVDEIWDRITPENFDELGDYAAYRAYFHELFGFAWPGIDYDAPTEINRPLV